MCAPQACEWRALLDATGNGIIIIDHRGRIEVFNRGAERLFGYAEQEVLGTNVSVLMTDGDRDAHDRYIARYLRSGVPHIIGVGRDVSARRKDGTTFTAFVSVGPVAGTDPPRFVGVVQDETLREQALLDAQRERTSLMRTKSLLHEAQRIAGLGNFELHDPGIHEDYWSPEAYRILGCDPERHVLDRARAASVVHPDDRAAFLAIWQCDAPPEEPREIDFRALQPEGGFRFVHCRYQSTSAADGGRRIAGTLHDVTQQKRQADEAGEARERLTHVSRLATLGEITAGIAHELNQPLAAIATYAQASEHLLGAREEHGEVRNALAAIAAQALRAGEIIRRLRGITRRQDGRREQSDPNQLIRDLAMLAEADGGLHDVRVAYDLTPLLPPIQVDQVHIQQVLLNLLRNAIEAIDGAGFTRREVIFRTRFTDGGEVEICVCDSGPGIAVPLRERVFEPFFTTKSSGTGLGLAISRSIVEAHGGKLACRRSEAGGACLYMRLPAVAR